MYHPQFRRIATRSISPLDVLTHMRKSPGGLESILRVTQYSLRFCCYLYADGRRPLSSKRRAWLRRTLLIVSLLSMSRKLLHLLDTIRALVGLKTRINFKLPSDDRGRLKAFAEITSNIIEAIVGLFDDLSLLRLLPSRYNRSASILHFVNVLVRTVEAELKKTELWITGRTTRHAMRMRDQADERIKTPTSTFSQTDWENLSPSERARSERSIARERRGILRECRLGLDRLWWTQIALLCDGVFSIYDVLEMQARGQGVRAAAGCASAWISFMEGYQDSARVLYHDQRITRLW
ncbi:uncharacterized protein MELLADRAFT_73360 [Melampsora larici-populina 98AG31]|uniref:Uncharacterized protein n=1 Tax=Melampsora larici-populina (strain 98AG31 / pathotype 3-4-7) TaxID=747676 RepID=F4S6Y4_MELLP|nr:uncharacterized protein MELLADRAFT_73360 [Melampsora larici-populina 98AG31]EGF99538.1 hypothetical protein MELLADRAFT_73360 [Melampsora larici-populina 98AG31]